MVRIKGKKKKVLSYRKKICYATLIVYLIPVFIFCIFCCVTSIRTVEKSTKFSMGQSLEKIGSAIEREMMNMDQALDILMRDKKLCNVLLSDKFKTSYDEILDYQYIKGTCDMLQETMKLNRIRIYMNRDTLYVNDNINFFSMKALDSKELSSEYRGWLAGYTFKYPYNNEEVIFSSYRIIRYYARAEIASAIFADIKESDLYKVVDSVAVSSKTCRTFIVNNEGIILSAEDKSRIGEGFEASYLPETTLKNTSILKIGKELVGIKNVGKDGWYVIQVMSNEQINIQNIPIIINLILVSLVAVFISSVVSAYISKGLSNRLLKLSEAIKNKIPFKEKRELYQDELDEVINTYNEMIEQKKKLSKEIYLTRLHEEQARSAMLQSQITPHFLYNILASIKGALDMGRNEEASEMIMNLSKFFQIVLSGGDERITIEEELQMVEKYIVLQNMIYPQQFTWKLEIDNNIKPFLITKFTLQPLIENAIRHGIRQKGRMGMLCINGVFSKDTIQLKVSDDGIGIDPHNLSILRQNLTSIGTVNKKGYGMCNVNTRLKLHWGERYGLTVKSCLGKGTLVVVTIPQEVR